MRNLRYSMFKTYNKKNIEEVNNLIKDINLLNQRHARFIIHDQIEEESYIVQLRCYKHSKNYRLGWDLGYTWDICLVYNVYDQEVYDKLYKGCVMP